MKNQSLHWVENARSLAALAVVLIHVTAYYISRPAWVLSEPESLFTFALNSAGRWAVPMFVMITGFLFLSRPSFNLRDFYTKRASRLIPPFVFFSVLYFLLAYGADYGLAFNQAGLNHSIHELVTLKPAFYHLWYLHMLIGLLAIGVPIAWIMASRLANKQLIITSSILLVGSLFAVKYPIFNKHDSFILIRFLPFFPLLLWGHLIGSGIVKIPKAGILTALLLIILAYFAPDFNSSHSIVVVPLTLALFQMLKDSPPIPVIIKLAPASFGIYLLHPIPLKMMERQPAMLEWMGVWVGIPLVFVITVVASLMLVKLTPKSLV
jgi:surface polysaccharide O-acyltransferase-like enzyme